MHFLLQNMDPKPTSDMNSWGKVSAQQTNSVPICATGSLSSAAHNTDNLLSGDIVNGSASSK